MVVLWSLSLVSMVIVLAGGLAHLLELSSKMRLPREEYAIVQQIYLLLLAGGCLALSLVVLFAVTFPINRETRNWIVLPAHWQQLRRRWEYSHASCDRRLAMLT
jgi:hypothetical protein